MSDIAGNTPGKRNRSQLSAGSTPSPDSKSIKMAFSPQERKLAIRNAVLEVNSNETADRALTEFQGLGLEDKVDNVFSVLLDLKISMSSISSTHQDHDKAMMDLETENEVLKDQLKSAQGKIIRLDSKIKKLELAHEELQWRQMKHNLVFYNLHEDTKENCEATIVAFLKEKMSIPAANIYSPQNTSGEIRIDIAHRVGKPAANRTRPIVVSFVTRKGRDMVLRQSSKLKRTAWGVGEQLPASMRERRSALVKKMSEIKKENPSANIKVTRDKMYTDKKETPSLFENNTLPVPSLEMPVRKYKDLSHTRVKVIKGSSFQGHAASIHSVEEAALAREALFQDPNVSTASSIMYAYRLLDHNHQVVRGYSDDREWLGGQTLDHLLDELKQDGVFVAVSRHHNGPNLGPARFDHIKATAQAAIDMEFMNLRDMADLSVPDLETTGDEGGTLETTV